MKPDISSNATFAAVHSELKSEKKVQIKISEVTLFASNTNF